MGETNKHPTSLPRPCPSYSDFFSPEERCRVHFRKVKFTESIPGPLLAPSEWGKPDDEPESEPKRIAIIGGGISGLAAYWALRKTIHHIDLFEQTNDVGTLTQPIFSGTQRNAIYIDKSFINFVPKASPNLMNFIATLRIPLTSAPCSFSVSKTNNGKRFDMRFQSREVSALRWSDWLALDTWKLWFDVLKFHYFSIDYLGRRRGDRVQFQTLIEDGLSIEWTVGDYLDRTRCSRIFIENYLLPMVQIAWNIQSEEDLREISIQRLVSFLWASGFLGPRAQVSIIDPEHGAEHRIKERIPLHRSNKAIHLHSRVVSVANMTDKGRSKLCVTTCSDTKLFFDYVIFAISPEEALRLLSDGATEKERQILGVFKTTKIDAWLHSDPRFVLPEQTLTYMNWADHTVFPPGNFNPVCVTYRLEAFPKKVCRKNPLCVTLNPVIYPDALKTVARWKHRRPLINAQTLNARKKLGEIQNVKGRNILFCGPWTGYGLHEDGVRSAFQLAMEHFGAKLPFKFVDSYVKYAATPSLSIWDRLIRALLRVIDALISMLRSISSCVKAIPVVTSRKYRVVTSRLIERYPPVSC
ncbi:hypothetical protein PRK78_006317 [Emydomyces testavorans]|uniref:Amine oxidase domain-containing protein n=1 Tax=Emydomyces testavorans TaxID=2070801 RepID=A0AAF0DM69_9EURO|nr:hypothetical protein PRK78_006317 [Emydomyces testavorans]